MNGPDPALVLACVNWRKWQRGDGAAIVNDVHVGTALINAIDAAGVEALLNQLEAQTADS